MKNLLLILFCFSFVTSCETNTREAREEINVSLLKPKENNYLNKVKVDTTNQFGKKIDGTSIEGTIGVITTSDKYNFGDTIKILNEKRTVINYIVIKEEYHVVALKCLSKSGKYYKIQTEDGKIGYIDKEAPGINYQTWDRHILENVFAVGFNTEVNPLKKNPGIQAPLISKELYDSDGFYHPVKIQNDWLQVKWGEEDNWQYGWIKWKNEGELLIELFYFA